MTLASIAADGTDADCPQGGVRLHAGDVSAAVCHGQQGATGPQAAGVIHTDFERGFIRAEVIAYDDYIALKGEQGAKEAGKLRLEGKEYIVREGDVMHFRFNV